MDGNEGQSCWFDSPRGGRSAPPGTFAPRFRSDPIRGCPGALRTSQKVSAASSRTLGQKSHGQRSKMSGRRLLTRTSLARTDACVGGLRLNFTRISSSAGLPRVHGYRCYTRTAGPGPSSGPGPGSGTGTVRIGCASGFWGDTATSVPQLVHGGRLDFLVFDYLSEITMSLLTAARAKSPNLGYAPDFVHAALGPFINDIHRKGIRVVSNAGGVNPLACGEAIREVIKRAGLQMKVAVVTGDDVMPQRGALAEVKMAAGDGAERQPLPRTLHSMNAYLGAAPVRRCLDLGADVVVTGRCVDSALALGPLMHAVRPKPVTLEPGKVHLGV
ncbi:uncharacterized protein ACNS7B_021185 [Menidia menidia]